MHQEQGPSAGEDAMNAKMFAVLMGAMLAIAFEWFQEDGASHPRGSVERATTADRRSEPIRLQPAPHRRPGVHRVRPRQHEASG